MTSLDLSRSREIYQPNPIHPRIHLIGVGATGSHIWDILISLGYPKVNCYDFDIVEEHNLGNQMYNAEDVGSPKVTALRQHTQRKLGLTAENNTISTAGLSYNFFNAKVGAATIKSLTLEGSHLIMLCIDGVESRKEFVRDLYTSGWGNINMLVETRIASRHGEVYTLWPQLYSQYLAWDSTLTTDDDEAYEASACGGSLSVKPTIMSVASTAVWAVLDHLEGNTPDHKVSTFMQPPAVGRTTNDQVSSVDQFSQIFDS